MKGMRNLLCFSLGLAIASFALPSVADNGKKIYSLNMAIVSAPPAQTPPPFTLKAVLKNEDPTGNSSFKSFSLSVTGLTVVGVDQPASGTATFTPSSVSVVNTFPVKPGQPFTVTLHVSSCGDGAWSAVVWTGTPFSGQKFDLVPGKSSPATPVSCGDLASGAQFTVPDSLNPNCITGVRGFYDKDGTAGSSVPYFVTNTVPTNDQLHFRWPDDNTGDPKATFEYSVCGSGPLPPAGSTQVAWRNTNGNPASTPGTPAFITALDCLDNANFLPEPYGALVGEGGVGAGDTTITVNTETPTGPNGSIAHPAAPFDIVIGTERMTVTSAVCGSNDGDLGTDPYECSEHEGPDIWTVTRAVGGTTAASHTPGVLVMSTPLPLLNGPPAPYGDGVAGHFVQAQMCIANEGEDEGGHFTQFIDIGDGWASGP